MDLLSAMIHDERERGDPEMQRRGKDLHARQEILGERERSLKKRGGQLLTRERNLRERQPRYAGTTGEGKETAPMGTGSALAWRTLGQEHEGRRCRDDRDRVRDVEAALVWRGAAGRAIAGRRGRRRPEAADRKQELRNRD